MSVFQGGIGKHVLTIPVDQEKWLITDKYEKPSFRATIAATTRFCMKEFQKTKYSF